MWTGIGKKPLRPLGVDVCGGSVTHKGDARYLELLGESICKEKKEYCAIFLLLFPTKVNVRVSASISLTGINFKAAYTINVVAKKIQILKSRHIDMYIYAIYAMYVIDYLQLLSICCMSED